MKSIPLAVIVYRRIRTSSARAFSSTDMNEYHVRGAKNVEEVCELVKTVFQYVTSEYSDDGKIFRKRKQPNNAENTKDMLKKLMKELYFSYPQD